MRIDLKEVIPKDITIINKLNKAESATGLDVWVKHTLLNVLGILRKSRRLQGHKQALEELQKCRFQAEKIQITSLIMIGARQAIKKTSGLYPRAIMSS